MAQKARVFTFSIERAGVNDLLCEQELTGRTVPVLIDRNLQAAVGGAGTRAQHDMMVSPKRKKNQPSSRPQRCSSL